MFEKNKRIAELKAEVNRLTELHVHERQQKLPDYSAEGRVLFYFGNSYDEDLLFNVEVLDYDADKATSWLHESNCMDSVIWDMVSLELDGHYVLEGVRGYVYQDYFGDVDVEWDFKFCRRASEEEIRTRALEDI